MPSRMLRLPSPSLPGFSWSLQALPSQWCPLKVRQWTAVGPGDSSTVPAQGKKCRGGIRKKSEVQQLGALLSLSFQGRAVGCFWYEAKERWALLGAGLVGRAALSEVVLADKRCFYWPELFCLPGFVHGFINNTEY